MCDRRVVSWLAVLLLAPAASSAQRATDAELARMREGIAETRASLARVAAEIDSVRRARASVPTDTLRLEDGRAVSYGRDVSGRLLQRVQTGLVDGNERLRGVVGAYADSLAPAGAWQLRLAGQTFRGDAIRLSAPGRPQQQRTVRLKAGFDSDEVQEFLLREAAEWAVARNRTLDRFVDGDVSFGTETPMYALAARNLALGNSTTGRRCLTGALNACRAVLAPANAAEYLARYYTPDDYRAVAARSRPSRAPRDSTANRLRAKCVDDGDAETCARVVRWAARDYPFRGEVRGSFAIHAITLGGESGLTRLQSAPSAIAADPYQLIVHIAGVPEDELLASWQARVSRAGHEDRDVPISRGLASVTLWCGICLGLALLRRPS